MSPGGFGPGPLRGGYTEPGHPGPLRATLLFIAGGVFLYSGIEDLGTVATIQNGGLFFPALGVACILLAFTDIYIMMRKRKQNTSPEAATPTGVSLWKQAVFLAILIGVALAINAVITALRARF